jgi:hypothetical protein
MSEGNTEVKLSYKLIEDGFVIYHNSHEYESKFDDYVRDEHDLINYVEMLNTHITLVENTTDAIVVHTKIVDKFKIKEYHLVLKFIDDVQRKEAKLNKQITQLLTEQNKLLTRLNFMEERLRKKYVVIGQFSGDYVYTQISSNPWMNINEHILKFYSQVQSIKFNYKDKHYKIEIELELFANSSPKLIQFIEENIEEKRKYEWKSDILTYSSDNKIFLGTREKKCLYLALVHLKYINGPHDHYIGELGGRYIVLPNKAILNQDHGLYANEKLLQEMIDL